MKVILVLDEMPETCRDCPCMDEEWDSCRATHKERFYSWDGIAEYCPLRPLPEHKKEMDYLAAGYNKCLDDILEGE